MITKFIFMGIFVTLSQLCFSNSPPLFNKETGTEFFQNVNNANMKVVTFNIDTNISRLERTFLSEVFPNWRAEARIPMIQNRLQQIKDAVDPDFICLQEGRAFQDYSGKEVDTIAPHKSFLETLNYQVEVTPYNETPLAFQYITAWNPERFAHIQTDRKYLTKTPDQATDYPDPMNMTDDEPLQKTIKEKNHGEYWERCVAISHLTDKQNNNAPVFLMNVHLGPSIQHRLASSDLIAKFCQHIRDEHPHAKIIVAGSLNTFPEPERQGPEQINKILTGGLLKQATDLLYLPNGNEIKSSFIAFPYDFAAKTQAIEQKYHYKDQLRQASVAKNTKEIYQETLNIFNQECFALGGQLDQVFYAGFSQAQSYLIPTANYPDVPKDYNHEETVKAYIMNHIKDGPAFASDSQPIVTLFETQS